MSGVRVLRQLRQAIQSPYRYPQPGLPLAAYDDLSAFKIYLADVGLLRQLSRLAPSAFLEGDRLFTEFKGSLTENYVLQALMPQLDVFPRYWTDGKGRSEVDFVIQQDNDLYPVEVKAEGNVQSPSLKAYGALYPSNTKLRIRFSRRNLKLDGDVLNIPLFLADQTSRLIRMAWNQG